MSQQPPDDLFSDTTMSFGEHLEELRGVLVKSAVALGICFLIGLYFANKVVMQIQGPLKQALEEYALETARLEGEATNVPEDLLKKRLEDRLLPDSVRIDAQALLGDLQKAAPDLFKEEIKLPDELQTLEVQTWKTAETSVKTLNAHEAFMIWMKAGFIFGFVLASPWIFYFVWSFVAAGLYPHEKKYIHIYLPFSLALFIAGAALAFLFVFEPVLSFLFSFNRAMEIDPDPRISEWMSFVLFLPLGFGLAFQLPLIMLFIQRLGMVSIETFVSKWRIAVLIIFGLSMFLTPADPISMLMMAIPLCCLYVLGILLCKWMPRNRNPFAEGYDP